MLRRLAKSVGALAFAALLTAPALAATGTELFDDPAAGDMFMRLLSYVIPGVGPVPENVHAEGGELQSAVKEGFMFFSGTLLFLAAMVSGWQIIAGIVASAKEGKVLGQKYHEVWAPIRTVIGFGMLAPVMGGLCAAQLLVIFFITWGGNLANLIWSPYVDAVTYGRSEKTAENAQNALASANLSIANDAVYGLLEKELCYHAIAAYDASARTPRPVNLPKDTSFQEHHMSWFGRTFAGQADTYWVADYGDVCGRAELAVTGETAEGNREQAAARTMDMARLDALRLLKPYLSALADSAAQTYIARGGSVEAFAPTGVVDLSIIRQARETYTTAISSAAVALYNTSLSGGNVGPLDKMRENAKNGGWATAGNFYLSISRLQSEVYSSGGKGLVFTQFQPEQLGGRVSPQVMELLAGTDEDPGVIPAFRKWWQVNIRQIAPDLSANVAVADSASGTFNSVLNQVFGGIVQLWADHEVDPMNAMQSMIDFGNRLQLYGMGAYAGAVAVQGSVSSDSIAGQFLNNIPLVGGATRELVSSVASLGGMLAMAVIATGAVHAYILPMIPYVMMFFFVASMLLLVVEALVAAPLWAFFHVRMDGDDFVSDVQRPGYMIAFNLILRAPLAIFGLILSLLTFGAMQWFASVTFWPAAEALSASSVIGPIGAVVLIALATYLHYQIAVRSFGLITQVPDRVSRWFGQGGEKLGEEEDSNRVSGFIVNNTQSKLEGVKGYGKGGRDAKDDAAKKKEESPAVPST